MNPLSLKDPAGFGNEFLRLTLLQGFQSLTKRDLELLIFVLLERDGAIGRDESNFTVAGKLRVTPAKVKALRRDGYARWRALVPEERDAALQRIVATVLTEANLKAGAKHVSERSRKDGFLAIRIEHPDDHQQFEQAILDDEVVCNGASDEMDGLAGLAEFHGTGDHDGRVVAQQLGGGLAGGCRRIAQAVQTKAGRQQISMRVQALGQRHRTVEFVPAHAEVEAD